MTTTSNFIEEVVIHMEENEMENITNDFPQFALWLWTKHREGRETKGKTLSRMRRRWKRNPKSFKILWREWEKSYT